MIDKVTAKLRRSLSINSSLKENLVPSTSADESPSSSKVCYSVILSVVSSAALVSTPISFENTCASDINLTTDVQDNRINLFVQILNTEQQEDSSRVGGNLAEDTVHVKEQVAE